MDKNAKVIIACVVLHNFAMMRGEPVEDEMEERDIPAESDSSSDISARHSRTLYIQQHFA